MKHWPTAIPTKELKLSDVPSESGELSVINHFAMTLDPEEQVPIDGKQQDWNLIAGNESLVWLRSQLYLEQRRWNHFGRRPDSASEAKIRELVGMIRSKLLGQNG